MVSGVQAANVQASPSPYTLVYQRNHGLLPHGSNTLLHGTNSGGNITSPLAMRPTDTRADACRVLR